MSTDVKQMPDQSRFVLSRDGQEAGHIAYTMEGGSISLTHAEIDPDLRGEGLGETLARGVLDTLRAETELRVVAACPFVRDFIDEHPEYGDLETR